jgi:hypothetical protein
MLWVMLGAVAAAVVASLVYVARERLGPRGMGLALLRTLAFAALIGLLVNATRLSRAARGPATVLLDASLSLAAAGGRWSAAADTARVLAGERGTMIRFGAEPTAFEGGEPDAGRSLVVPALRAAAARGGPVYLVTDGELEDGGTVPEALLAGVTPVVVPRHPVPDAAIRDAGVPRAIGADDSLEIHVEIVTGGGLADSAATLEVSEGGRTLARRSVPLPPSPGAGRRTVTLPTGALGPGTHVLDVRLVTPGDGEPRNDVRRRVVTVGAVPEVVVVASPPDWESRFLARELADVTGSAVRAFAAVTPGRWVDMRSGRAITEARVAQAVRGAELVIRTGDGTGDPWVARTVPASWTWPSSDDALEGDWYPEAPLPASPLAARLGGVAWDSVPPVAAVQPLAPPPDAWIALSARLARRGAERPLLLGRDTAGTRMLTTAGHGLWRWALRGGAPREAYRSLLAAGVDWLLTPGRAGGAARMRATEVVPRGVPVTFRWQGDTLPAAPVPVTLTSGDGTRTVELAFDAQGEARQALEPGVYRWRATEVAGAAGLVVVEEYSDEFVARPVAVPAGVTWESSRRRVGARENWWMFALALGALVVEWAWRVRRGLP